MSEQKTKGQLQAEQFADKVVAAILLIVVAIMPLVVRIATLQTPPELVHYVMMTEFHDVFAYWKGFILNISALLLLLYLVSDLATGGHIRPTKASLKKFFTSTPVVLSLVYLLFVTISAFRPGFWHTSFRGTFHRNEGLFTWFSYFIVFFATMLYVRQLKHAKILMSGMIFSSIIMGLIGATQFIGMDFFNTRLAAHIVLGTEQVRNSLAINPDATLLSTAFDIAHGTLFNPNTFGKYTAMVSPILLLCAFTYDGKRWVNGLFLLAGMLMLVSVFGSSSLGGLIGIVTAVFVLAGTYLCGLIYRGGIRIGGFSAKYIALSIFGVMVTLVLAIMFIAPLNYRVNFLFGRLGDAMRAETHSGYRFSADTNVFNIYHAGNLMYSVVINEPSQEAFINLRNAAGQFIPPAEIIPHADLSSGYIYHFDAFDQEGNPIRIARLEEAVVMNGFSGLFHFQIFYDNGNIYGRMINNDIVDFAEPVPAWGFYGRETWGSARGFIWSRTFPMMPSRTLIGHGPDTFVNVFPNHDILGLQMSFGNPYTHVDKAHNLFLQTWITTGGISALALFALFAYYLFTTFISLIKSKNEPIFSYGLRLGLLSGISAFVMSSMATDSTIGSTGVFFVLLGMGFGLNKIIQSQPEI